MLVAGTALVALVATRAGLAEGLANWFSRADPFVANLGLTMLVGPSLVLALVSQRRHRKSVDAQKELSHLSRHDPLTGLPNRTSLQAVVRRGIHAVDHHTMCVAALFCDLDRFKVVNDTYGHEVGDQLMIRVARRIQEVVGRAGTALRYGGDEFIVIQPVAGRSEAERMAQRLLEAIEVPFEVGMDTMRISVSIGVALSDVETSDADDLVRDADVAMYQAKAAGAGAVCMYDPSIRARLSRSTAEARLRWAIDHHEIRLLYEPVLTVREGTLVAVRARLDWEDPHRGSVPAREFMPALEETGLILEVGTWALGEACSNARRWRELAPERVPLQVVMPITARQLAQSNFRDLVAAVIEHSGAERAQLCLAVADSSLVDDITDAWTMLRHARTLGVQVALDSFGASGSTLADLRRARFDQLWLDRALMAGIDAGSDDAIIVEHLIEMAHRLDLLTIATDVDSATQLAVLRQLGCDRAHGPFLGMALTRDEIDLLVARPVPGPPDPAPAPATSPAAASSAASALSRLRSYSPSDL